MTESDSQSSDSFAAKYTVVARRYRPQSFEQLVGQSHVSRALENAINTNRVGHAYLFTGARGVGKTSAARILAKALDCVNGPSPSPCNQCDVCLSITAGGDVDVLEIDGASNRGIDEVRQLRSNVNVRPSRAKYKIYIIDEVHMLTMPAFNALLKTLEEPPAHVKFIFCTTDPDRIPITVLSRCQRFDFAGIQVAEIVERLNQIAQSEGAAVESEALEIVARRAAGSMRDSQSLLEQLLAFGPEAVTATDVHAMLGTADSGRLALLVDHLVQHDGAAALRELDTAINEGVDVGALVDQLSGYFRDLMADAVGCPPELMLYTSKSNYEKLSQTSRSWGLETILAGIQVLDRAAERIRQSTFPRVILETALVRICKLEDLDELASMIARLQETDSGPLRAEAGTGAVKKKINKSALRADSSPVDSTVTDGGGPDVVTRRSLTPESAVEIWKAVIAMLTDLTADHAANFHRVANSAPNRLEVFFEPRYNACKLFCERPDRREKLETALFKVTGQRIGLEFSLETDSESVTSPPPAVSRRQQMQEAANQPLVRQVIELFDAEMLRVVGPREG